MAAVKAGLNHRLCWLCFLAWTVLMTFSLLLRYQHVRPLPGETAVQQVEEKTRQPVEKTRGRMTVLVHTSAATWATRAAAVRETMLSKPLPPGVNLYWVATDELPPNAHPVIHASNIFRPGGDPEPRGAMNERVLQSFAQVLNPEEFQLTDWYLKMDDDTYVNITNALELVKDYEIPHELAHYIGTCSCTFAKGVEWCRNVPEMANFFNNCSMYGDDPVKLARKYNCGGPGYLLSLAALQKLVKYEQTYGVTRSYEDIAVGWALYEVGIRCWDRSGPFLDYGPEAMYNLPKTHEDCREMVGFHKALPESMRFLHRCAAYADCTPLKRPDGDQATSR